MKLDYATWITFHVPPDPTGLCQQITAKMVAAFPELKRIRGHYTWTGSTDRPWPHWWCVTDTGEIVDPTAAQWPDSGRGVYDPWDESQGEPTGKCPNCGGYCFNGDSVCSENCQREYVAYLKSGIL